MKPVLRARLQCDSFGCPMNKELDKHFEAIGARVRLRPPEPARRTSSARGRRPSAVIDIRKDRKGEYFDLQLPENAEARVTNLDRAGRHLLLYLNINKEKSRYLCGHDERHWFVAAIPESAPGITTVAKAKAALQPDQVRTAGHRLRSKERLRRRNDAYIRQGEWFFVPEPDLRPDPKGILRHEPISRGLGSKPHVAEVAYRRGGVTVYVSAQHPSGLTQAEYELVNDKDRRGSWQVMVRDAEVFAMGTIRHADHATVRLSGWHRVLMNTEPRARAMRHVAFLD